MKKRFTSVLALFATVAFIIPVTVTAQEEKEKEIEKTVEKRIKIVTVDEKGEKTIIDTVLTGDEDMEEILTGSDLRWISEEGAGEKIVKTEDGEVYVFKKGDKESFSIVSIDEDSADKHKNILIHIDEDVVHSKDGKVIMKSSKGENHAYVVKVDKDGKDNIAWHEKPAKLKDGQVHIMIHSNNEVEDLIIDGDAVITIKDGKVKVEGDGLKINIAEEGEEKLVKEKKVKKEKKK